MRQLIHDAQIGDVLPLNTFPNATLTVIRVPTATPVLATDDIDAVLWRVLTDEPMLKFSFLTFERTPDGWRRTE